MKRAFNRYTTNWITEKNRKMLSKKFKNKRGTTEEKEREKQKQDIEEVIIQMNLIYPSGLIRLKYSKLFWCVDNII